MKIHSIDSLTKVLNQERKKGKKIVLCHGVFDLLHAGHIFHFKSAKQHGDILIVSVTPDHFVNKGPNRPHFSEIIRMQNLSEVNSIDYVVLNEWPTAIEAIVKLKPHVYAKGNDYSKSKEDVTGNIKREKEAIKEMGGEIVFTDEPALSSSRLLNELFPAYSEEARKYLEEFKKKHSLKSIYKELDKIESLKVLVIGEAICDEYIYCQPLAKSTKETIIATKCLNEEKFLGGALTIANHVSNLSKGATLITNLGNEKDINAFVSKKLNPNVKLKNIDIPNRSTIIKRRFVEANFNNKMFEMQIIDDSPIPPASEEKLIETIAKEAEKHDLVIVADYGHGFINQKAVECISSLDQFTCVNTQTNSANLGFNYVTKYKKTDFICIDEAELKFACNQKYTTVEDMVSTLKEKISIKNLMVSLGAKGTVFFPKDKPPEKTPIFSNKVVDRTGAGDTLFSLTAPLLYLDCPTSILGLLANCAGALAVKTMCNREQIDPPQLKKFVKALLA